MTTFSIVLIIFFAAALIGWLWTCLSLAASRREIDEIEESFLGQIEKYREAVSREYANHASCKLAKEELEVANQTIEKLTADLCHAAKEAVSREYANHASCKQAKEELEAANQAIEKLTADLRHAVGAHGAAVSELIDLRSRFLTHKNFVFGLSKFVEDHRKSLVEE